MNATELHHVDRLWHATPRYPIIVVVGSTIALHDGDRVVIGHRHRRTHRSLA